MVVGEQRPYLAALVVVNADEWARENGRLDKSPPERQAAFLLRRIAGAVKDFPAYATPRAVWWTTEPWTIAGSLLTPTLKVKRIAMGEMFAVQIDALVRAQAHQGRILRRSCSCLDALVAESHG
jgi:long-chain acyl-CoA synthetase